MNSRRDRRISRCDGKSFPNPVVHPRSSPTLIATCDRTIRKQKSGCNLTSLVQSPLASHGYCNQVRKAQDNLSEATYSAATLYNIRCPALIHLPHPVSLSRVSTPAPPSRPQTVIQLRLPPPRRFNAFLICI
ncbi:hypothetical protein FJTKL_13717 [Diaporthe vaccinii]|uniref:Uncharacterized protein n=1 Tax=Diaporthe vaccinii TaxID=105482 RepID=A0ABR4E9R9_9PEZI